MHKLTFTKLDSTSPQLLQAKQLYKEAFPKEERIDFSHLLDAAKRSESFQVLSGTAGDVTVAFVTLAISEKMVYVAYLAIEKSVRGKGLGTNILTMLQKKFPNHTLVLDIERCDRDAANIEQRKARRSFYVKNGFKASGFHLIYPEDSYELLYKGDKVCKESFEKVLSSIPLKEIEPVHLDGGRYKI